MTMTLMKNLTAGLALAVAIVGGSSSTLAQKKGDGSQAITIDPTGSVGTFPQQILNSGTVVGYYLDTGGMAHGFIRSVGGKYTTIDVPGAAGTQAYGINDKGTVVGWWFEPPTANGSVYHGYLREKGGNLTYFDVPGAGPYLPPSPPPPFFIISLPVAINLDGTVAGSYLDTNNVYHSFVRSRDGGIVTFDAPGAGTGPLQGTLGDTNGINRQGAFTGGYTTADYVIHPFLRDPGGAITTFDQLFDPLGAGTAAGQGSYFNLINDAGTIPGVIIDKNFVQHGFVLSQDGAVVTFDVAGAGTGTYQGTLATATNVSGTTAGIYVDANGVNHGYVRSRHGSITTFDVPSEGTGSGQGVFTVGSINEAGAVEGWYIDTKGVNHGFIYK